MPSLAMNIQEPYTLAQIMAAGRLPVTEALSYALSLAEVLRTLHESGGAHGALTPSQIVINGGKLELLPLFECGRVTPYTAPELLAGAQPDSRSDIFSFGAILYELFTGRRAFEGEGPEALALSLSVGDPPSSGSPSVDRVLNGCLAKDPAARFQRVQKLMLEMKLLSVAARRAKAPAIQGWESAEAGLRAEMQGMESRLAASLQRNENAIALLERTAGEALNTLRSEVAAANDERAAVLTRLNAIEETLASGTRRLDRIEPALAAVDSIRTALAQTDDLVERVVEALESLQTMVLDQAERRPHAS